ncbi:hypothetical protein OG21DRAFT_1488962 [Imleria badia]|nr:hypothetical protein OG21DRAFT_1488962 [Imleria badia]
MTRYQRFGDVTDLEKSISLLQDAVQSTPGDHPNKLSRLNNLGGSLLTRYNRFGDIADLERSILLREDVLQLIPDGHPEKPVWLNNLGHLLITRYERFGDIVDLEKSVSLCEDAVRFAPDGHRANLKAFSLNNLGCALSTRYEPFGEVSDLRRSISLVDHDDALKSTPNGHPDKPSRLSNLGDSFLTRYNHFGDITDLERSISVFEDAVRFTPKQLRLLGTRCRLRTPVDDLRTAYPELAAQFEHASRQLEHAGVRSTIKQLSSLTHSGPVLLLNASRYRCDALVVVEGSEDVVYVPLSNTSLSYDEVSGVQLQLQDLLRLKGRVMLLRDDADRGVRVRGRTPDEVFRSTLPCLWEKVVSPILEVLPLSKLAGLYGTTNPGPKLSDFAITSYIPTMSATPERLGGYVTPYSVACCPSMDGQAHLTSVRGEIELIRKLGSSSPFVAFQEADRTVEDALSKMTETDWSILRVTALFCSLTADT